MLQWLIDQVTWAARKIQEIIDWAYGLYLSALRVAQDWGKWAIEQAKSIIINYYNLAIATLNYWVSYLYNISINFRDEVVRYAYNLVNGIVANINNFIAAIGYYIAPYIEAIKGWVEASFSNVYNWVLQQLAPFISTLGWISSSIAGLINLVNSLRVLSLDDVIKIVTGQIQPILQNIRDFVNDPIGYILAVIVDYFGPILSAFIAYGMGTTKYDLPPAPTYYTKSKR